MLVDIFLVLLTTYLFGCGAIEVHRRLNAWTSPLHCYAAGMAAGLVECTLCDGPWWLALADGMVIGAILYSLGRSARATDNQPINQSNSTDTQHEIPQS